MDDVSIMLLMIAVAIVAAVILIFNSPKGKGWLGEKRVAHILKKSCGEGDRVFNNVIIKNGSMTSQIDHILVSRHGVFVVETKNYAGKIYGDDNMQEWTQYLANGRVVNKFYSPVKQNLTHVFALKNILNNVHIESIVVFVQGNVGNINSNCVFSLSQLKKYLKSMPVKFSSQQRDVICDKIQDATLNISIRKHVKNIEKQQQMIDQNICPRCGSPLILREGEYGKFYGCSAYPKCKFTKKM